LLNLRKKEDTKESVTWKRKELKKAWKLSGKRGGWKRKRKFSTITEDNRVLIYRKEEKKETKEQRLLMRLPDRES
jgi:hypothetical protein